MGKLALLLVSFQLIIKSILYEVPPPLQDIIFSDAGVIYTYGQTISFRVIFNSQNPVEQIFLHLQPNGQSERILPMTMMDDQTAVYNHDTTKDPLHPYVVVKYWYQAMTPGAEDVISNVFGFQYLDNRFNWQEFRQDGIHVHWYQGDLAFGQAALTAATNSLSSMQSVLPADTRQEMHVYIYASQVDLQAVLDIGQQPWVIGHATPDMDIALIALPVGGTKPDELANLVNHELAHLLQYRLSGEDWNTLPIWLKEGTAVLMEKTPDPEYSRILDAAIIKGEYIPIESLCTSFPREKSSAYLAYAESASFVGFLRNKFGDEFFINLVDAYNQEPNCGAGLLSAFGMSLPDLEAGWVHELQGVARQHPNPSSILPYLTVFILLIAIPLIPVLANRKKFVFRGK